MAIRSQEAITYPAPYGVVFDACMAALASLGLKVKGADPAGGIITADQSMGLASWGENIELTIWSVGESATNVQVGSSLKFGLVDWGKNKSNTAKIHRAISERLLPNAAPGPAAGLGAHATMGFSPAPAFAPRPPAALSVPLASSAPAAWHPDPGGRHELRWWDGQRWTHSVSDAGEVSDDPL
jgi:Protein of unknown function (DUF2510)